MAAPSARNAGSKLVADYEKQCALADMFPHLSEQQERSLLGKVWKQELKNGGRSFCSSWKTNVFGKHQTLMVEVSSEGGILWSRRRKKSCDAASSGSTSSSLEENVVVGVPEGDTDDKSFEIGSVSEGVASGVAKRAPPLVES